MAIAYPLSTLSATSQSTARSAPIHFLPHWPLQESTTKATPSQQKSEQNRDHCSAEESQVLKKRKCNSEQEGKAGGTQRPITNSNSTPRRNLQQRSRSGGWRKVATQEGFRTPEVFANRVQFSTDLKQKTARVGNAGRLVRARRSLGAAELLSELFGNIPTSSKPERREEVGRLNVPGFTFKLGVQITIDSRPSKAATPTWEHICTPKLANSAGNGTKHVTLRNWAHGRRSATCATSTARNDGSGERGGETTRESTDGRSLVTEHKREFVQMAQSRCTGKPDHILMILGCVVRRCGAGWARLGRVTASLPHQRNKERT